MARLLYVRVPIFTEEFAIHVYYGRPEAFHRAAERRTGQKLGPCAGRGIAWNCYDDAGGHNPVIGVVAGRPRSERLATLAHEASHAMDYIAERIRISDNGEFRAHGIAAVLRVAGPKIVKGA